MPRFADIEGLRVAITRGVYTPSSKPHSSLEIHFVLLIGLVCAIFTAAAWLFIPLLEDLSGLLGLSPHPDTYINPDGYWRDEGLRDGALRDLHGITWLSLAEPVPALFYGLALFSILHRERANYISALAASLVSSYIAWWIANET